MSHVFDLHESGHRTFGGGFSGTASLAALLPTPAGEVSYLYRELHGDAIRWWTPLDWIERVERWIPIAAGHSECAIDLIAFLRPLEDDERVKVGLPWLAALTLRDPANIARRTHSVPTWLVDTRATAAELNMLSEWQEIVDALVVAGESQLAPYFE